MQVNDDAYSAELEEVEKSRGVNINVNNNEGNVHGSDEHFGHLTEESKQYICQVTFVINHYRLELCCL